jgi:hypothetical protein
LALFREVNNQLDDLVVAGSLRSTNPSLSKAASERGRHFGEVFRPKRMIMFEEEPNGHALLLIAHAAVVK